MSQQVLSPRYVTGYVTNVPRGSVTDPSKKSHLQVRVEYIPALVAVKLLD